MTTTPLKLNWLLGSTLRKYRELITSLCFTDTEIHSNQRAEMEACKDVLESPIKLRAVEMEYLRLLLHRVVLKVDLEYVVKEMTECILKCMESG